MAISFVQHARARRFRVCVPERCEPRAAVREQISSSVVALGEDLPDSFGDRASACLQLLEPLKCETWGNPDITQDVCPGGADFLQFAVKLPQFGCLIWPEGGLSGSQLPGSQSHRFVFNHTRQCYAEARRRRVTGLTVGAQRRVEARHGCPVGPSQSRVSSR